MQRGWKVGLQMSNEALNWAFSQHIKPASVKFVLVVLADHSNIPARLAWPSILRLCDRTGLDRKTIIKSLDVLEAQQRITNTGKRKGQTGQIKVYQLNYVPPNSFHVQKEIDSNLNNSGGETVPIANEKSLSFFGNSASYPSNSSKTGTRNPVNLNNPKQKNKEEKSENFVLPNWIPDNVWEGYMEMRRKKLNEPTVRARILIIKKLDKLRDAGFDITTILDNSTMNGWSDVYPPKPTVKTKAFGTAKNDRSGAAAAIFDVMEPEILGVINAN